MNKNKRMKRFRATRNGGPRGRQYDPRYRYGTKAPRPDLPPVKLLKGIRRSTP